MSCRVTSIQRNFCWVTENRRKEDTGEKNQSASDLYGVKALAPSPQVGNELLDIVKKCKLGFNCLFSWQLL